MRTKGWLIFILLLAVPASLLVFPTRAARADTGPKPAMTFVFKYEITPAPAVVSGTLLECSDPDCADATPLQELGPQGFRCQEGRCASLGYGYLKYHRLAIEFSDGQTRESNVFTKNHFEAYYTVRVLENSLQVKETGGTFLAGTITREAVLVLLQEYLNPGLAVTILVELVLGVIYVLWRRRPRLPALLTILLMNLVTQPAVWLLSKTMRGATCAATWVLEAGVCLLEAWILYRVLRKTVKFSETLLLSLALNLASFGIGLLLPF